MVSLELQSITKCFGSTKALEELGWSLKDGNLGVIIGPSGSGKTTLLKIIAGLLFPDSGNVLFDGRSIIKKKASERNIGYVPQSLALFPHLTVEQNLAFGLEAKKWKKGLIKERIKELLELGDIQSLSKRYPREISGGQQQRVALLRALAPQPEILLLDEPLGLLDIQLRARMLGIIRSIQRKTSTTTVMVSHNPQETLLGADEVLIIDQGHVIQTGKPQEVLKSPTFHASPILGVKNYFPASIIDQRQDYMLVDTYFGKIRLLKAEMDNNKKLRGIQIPSHKINISDKNESISDVITLEGMVSQVIFLGDQVEIAFKIAKRDFFVFVNLESRSIEDSWLEIGNSMEFCFYPSDIRLIWK